MRYIAFDVETPNRYNDRISAIGIAVVEDGEIVHSFYSLVNPEAGFDWFNTQLTGIDEAAVADAPTFAELWDQIEPIMGRGIIVGLVELISLINDPGFDIIHINSKLNRIV